MRFPSLTRRAMRRIWFCSWILTSLDTLPVSKNTQLISNDCWLTLFILQRELKERVLTTQSLTPRVQRSWLKKRRLLCWEDHAWARTLRLRSESGNQRSSRWVSNETFNFAIIIPNYCIIQDSVDKLMAKTNASMMAGGSSWLEQFTGAFEVQAGKWLDMITRGQKERGEQGRFPEGL